MAVACCCANAANPAVEHENSHLTVEPAVEKPMAPDGNVTHLAKKPTGLERTKTPVLSAYDDSEHAPRELTLGEVPVPADKLQGLDLLQSEADELLVIVGVAEGSPWAAWNAEHPEDPAEPGDQILAVNGKCEHEEAWSEITGKCDQDRKMSLRIRKPTENRIRVTKHDDDSMGLVLIHLDGGLLFIDSVQPDGLVHQWNLEHSDHKVRCLDQIVEVNGQKGSPDELVKALAETGEADLVLRTHPQ